MGSTREAQPGGHFFVGDVLPRKQIEHGGHPDLAEVARV